MIQSQAEAIHVIHSQAGTGEGGGGAPAGWWVREAQAAPPMGSVPGGGKTADRCLFGASNT